MDSLSERSLAVAEQEARFEAHPCEYHYIETFEVRCHEFITRSRTKNFA